MKVFHGLAKPGKKLLTSRKEDRKIMQFIKITTQQHYMPICVANSIYLGSNQEHQSRMKTKFHAKQYDRFIETNQSVRGAS